MGETEIEQTTEPEPDPPKKRKYTPRLFGKFTAETFKPEADFESFSSQQPVLHVPSPWEQRCMFLLGQVIDGVVAEFVIAGDRENEKHDVWRRHAGGILFFLASILKTTDIQTLETFAAQAGTLAFKKLREAGIDPLSKESFAVGLAEAKAVEDRKEKALKLNDVWGTRKRKRATKARGKSFAKGHPFHPAKSKLGDPQAKEAMGGKGLNP